MFCTNGKTIKQGQEQDRTVSETIVYYLVLHTQNIMSSLSITLGKMQGERVKINTFEVNLIKMGCWWERVCN